MESIPKPPQPRQQTIPKSILPTTQKKPPTFFPLSKKLVRLPQRLTQALAQLLEEKEPKETPAPLLKRSKKKRIKRNPAYPTHNEKKLLVIAYKAEGCQICGETRPYLLDLHHMTPATKRFSISRGVRMSLSLRTFKNELLKTTPLCRNHHALYHHLNAECSLTTEQFIKDQRKLINDDR